MVTVIAAPGHLRTALLERLSTSGQPAHLYDSATDDLFLLAMKSTAIVYALEDAPGTFEEALRAMSAPGVRRFVLVSGGGSDLDARRAILRKRGVPYIIVKAPRLLEEALDELVGAQSGRIWLPSDFKLIAASAAAVSDAVVGALDASSDGTSIDVDAQTLDADQVTAHLRTRSTVQASTLPKVLYSLGKRLGAIGKTNRRGPLMDRTAA
jgi:hypothetical protein